MEPYDSDVGEDRRLDYGGDEKCDPGGAIRGEETGEEEDQGEQRRMCPVVAIKCWVSCSDGLGARVHRSECHAK